MEPARADRIRLQSRRMPCRIGVAPGEADRAQPVRLRIELDLDLGPAARSGSLADTADYGELFAAARALVVGRRWGLLEELAGAVLGLSLADPRVLAARVRLTKLAPPMGEFAGPVSVELGRRRGETP